MIQVVNQFPRVGIHRHIVFRRADFRRAAGQDEVLRVDGVDDILRRRFLALSAGRFKSTDTTRFCRRTATESSRRAWW
jgi:hypothetical protein